MASSLHLLAAAQVAKLKLTIVALSEPWVVSLHPIPHRVKMRARDNLSGMLFVTIPSRVSGSYCWPSIRPRACFGCGFDMQ